MFKFPEQGRFLNGVRARYGTRTRDCTALQAAAFAAQPIALAWIYPTSGMVPNHLPHRQ